MTPIHCNVCAAPLGRPVYHSAENASITTMNKVIVGQTEIFFCGACGHLQTTELPNLVQYYALEYEVNLQNDDDDQLYKVIDGRPVYRAEHQANVLLDKVAFPDGARVLDYGCAKAATLRKILAHKPGIQPFAFDVTEKYVPFWEKFVAPDNWAAHKAKPDWNGTIDVLLSFYALEHVSDIRAFLDVVWKPLKVGGTFYFVVPNAYLNVADFVVADHINHFSEPSLRAMLAHAGFEALDVDAESHDAAFIVVARKLDHPVIATAKPVVVDTLRLRVAEMVQFWSDAVRRIRTFETALSNGARRAIYGAGFYGNFIAFALKEPEKVECFIDQNVHLQGREIHGKPVIAPVALDPGVDAIFIGLNPARARQIIEGVAAWRDRRNTYLFL